MALLSLPKTASLRGAICLVTVLLGCATPSKRPDSQATQSSSQADSVRWEQRQHAGERYLSVKQIPEAESAFGDALDASRGAHDFRAQLSLAGLVEVAQAYADQQRHGDVERVSRRVLETGADPDARTRLHARRLLAISLESQHRVDEAAAEANKAYEDASGQYPPKSQIVLDFLLLKANGAMDVGRYDEAERGFREVLEVKARVAGTDTPSVAWVANDLAMCLLNEGRLIDAQAAAQRSLAVYQKLNPEPPQLGSALDTVAQIDAQLGKPEQAQREYERAAQILRRYRPTSDHQLVKVLQHQERQLKATNHMKEADEVEREIVALGSDQPPVIAH